MTPIEASSLFATLVGLICNWKQERGTDSSGQFENFLLYLTNHNFQELRSQIINSNDLQRELHVLLKKDTALITEKLDIICQGLSSLSDRIETLAPLSRAIQAPTDALSDQAAHILKIFDQTNSLKMIAFLSGELPRLIMLPSQYSPRITFLKFLNDDLESLIAFGFMAQSDFSSAGNPILTITRSGSRYAQQLPDVDLGPIDPVL